MASISFGRWLTPQRIVIIIGVAILGWTLYFLSEPLLPVFIALFLAYAFNPIIDKYENWRGGRTGAVLILMGIILVIMVVFLLYLIPAIFTEVEHLTQRLPLYFKTVHLFITQQLAPWLHNRANITLPTSVLEIENILQDQIQALVTQVGSTLNTGFRSAIFGTLGVVKILLNILLIPFFFFFFLKDFPTIKHEIKQLIPRRYFDYSNNFVSKANKTLAHFFRGQLTIASILAVLYTTGLTIIGVDLSIFLGVLSGLLFLIPYVGLAVALGLTITISFLNFSGFGQIVWILVLYAVLPMIEMFFLTPKIVGSRLKLSPAIVILSLLCFGGLFGIFGVIIALPSTALFKMIYEELLSSYKHSHYYLNSEEEAKAAAEAESDCT